MSQINFEMPMFVQRVEPHCKKCGSNLTGAAMWGKFYSCRKCDAWTDNVEARLARSIGMVRTDCA